MDENIIITKASTHFLVVVLYYRHIGFSNGEAGLQNTKAGQGSTGRIPAGEIPQTNYPKNSWGSTLDWGACMHLWRIGSFAEIPGRTEVSYETVCKSISNTHLSPIPFLSRLY